MSLHQLQWGKHFHFAWNTFRGLILIKRLLAARRNFIFSPNEGNLEPRTCPSEGVIVCTYAWVIFTVFLIDVEKGLLGQDALTASAIVAQGLWATSCNASN